MSRKFLIDLDLILEAILNRPNLFKDTELIWKQIESEAIEAYVTEPGLDKIISIIRSLSNSEEEANKVTELIQSVVKIAYVDSEKLHAARQLPLKDFESAIELICAHSCSAVAVVTHRPEEFEGLESYPVQVWSIAKFLEFINLNNQSFFKEDKLDLEKNLSDRLYFDVYNYFRENYIKKQPIFATCPINSKPKSNLPEITTQHFMWREGILRQLFLLLQKDCPFQVISVCGEVGVGKTSLALQTAHLCKEARALGEYSCLPIYDAFILVSPIHDAGLTASPTSICKTVSGDYLGYLTRTIALTLGDDSINRTSGEERLQRLYGCLSRQKTLLILDGLDCLDSEQSELENFLKHLPKSTKAVITSRHNDLGYRRLELERFNHDETVAAIQKILETEHLVLKEDEISQISQYCLGNPLVMKVVILQHTNYPGSITWEREGSDITVLLQFLADTLFKSLKSKRAEFLLMVLAFARNSFDLEVLTHFFLGESSESKVRNNLAELSRLSLVIEDGKRYALNPIVRELVLLFVQRMEPMTERLHDRLSNSYLKLAEKYGGTDWGNWHANYDFLEAEWENLQSVLQWCVSKNYYQPFKQLWKQLNHFADLYGYWSDRVFWLDCLIYLSKANEDWANHVFALSRKAWTLTMINQPDSLAEAEILLSKAWNLRDKTDFEAKSYLSHQRVVFYIRCKRYKEASQALVAQKNVLATSKSVSLERRILTRHRLNFLRDQAKLDYEQDRLELARKRYEIVLKKTQEINWLRGVCYTHNKLADIALRQGDLERAEKHLIAGLPIARQNRNKRRLAGYEKSFARLEELRGDSSAAQGWAKLAIHHYNFIGMESESQKLAAAFGL